MVRSAIFWVSISLISFGLSCTGSSQEKSSLQDTKSDQQLSARAQERIERRLDALDKELQLTDEQKDKIRDLYEKEAANLIANFDRSQFRSMSREERFERMQEIRDRREKTNQKIEEILTPEQTKKFRAYLEEMRERMRGNRRRRF